MGAIGLRAGTSAWRWVAILAVALGGLVAVEQWQSRPLAPERQAAAPVTLTGMARSHADALARIDTILADAQAQAAAGTDQWLLHEVAARHHFERARLSGSFDDYAATRAALDRGFAVARPRTGPHLVGAQLDFAMHRLAGAERQLALIDDYAIPPAAEERAEMTAMRGDIAFYRGDLARALALYDEADELARGTATFRRAIHAARVGDVDRAEVSFNQSERETSLPPPHLRGYFELQRGILDLDRGRLDDAMAHFRRADGIFPGHWLIEEHIAEVLTLQGKLPEAERRYRAIVRRTGHPEFMDALAGVLAAQGRRDEAQHLTDRAWGAWQTRLAQFPEAAYGHALDHCIGKADWPCALRLAIRNHDARPYGDAKVALARALLGSGRADAAQRVIEPVLASPWRTADLHRTAADIYQARGLAAQAADQDRRARAINPLA